MWGSALSPRRRKTRTVKSAPQNEKAELSVTVAVRASDARSVASTESRASKMQHHADALIATDSSTRVKSFGSDGAVKLGTGDHSNIPPCTSAKHELATARLFASACPLRSEISVYA
jgi:hypothetical protein